MAVVKGQCVRYSRRRALLYVTTFPIPPTAQSDANGALSAGIAAPGRAALVVGREGDVGSWSGLTHYVVTTGLGLLLLSAPSCQVT